MNKNWRETIKEIYLTPEEVKTILQFDLINRRFICDGSDANDRYRKFDRKRKTQFLVEAAFVKAKTGSIDDWVNVSNKNLNTYENIKVISDFRNWLGGNKQNLPDEMYGVPIKTWIRNYQNHFEWEPEKIYVTGFIWYENLQKCEEGITVNLIGWVKGSECTTGKFGFDGWKINDGKFFNHWDVHDIQELVEKESK